jgi:hypothetical protein
MEDRARSPLRLLAPVALVVATLAFFLILTGSGDDEPQPAGTGAAAQQAGPAGDRGDGGRSQPETYEVQSGDTLDAISVETGVSVERIQALNPDLDPQSLIAGQELKLSD